MSHAPSTMRRHGTVAPSGRGIVLRSFDPVARGARTLFPSRVFAPDEVQRVIKSGHQSRKIGAFVTKGWAKGWPIYTLTLEERATCPQTCGEWLSCYGNNMQAAERIEDGLDLHLAIESEIADLAESHPGGFLVRLHVLGDFPSLAYVALWARMLSSHTALHLFGFTARSPDTAIGKAVAMLAADFGWKRAAIRFSGQPHALRAAQVVEAGGDPADAIPCPAQSKATDCCGTCALCWQSERSIAFWRH